jgi:hypothetical protein
MRRPLLYTALAVTTALTLSTGHARAKSTSIVTVVEDVKACDNYVDALDGKTSTHPFRSGQPVYLKKRHTNPKAMLQGSESLDFSLVGYALAQLNHTTYRTMTYEEILKPLSMTMSSTAFTEAMRAHLAPGHLYTGAAAKNWDHSDARAPARSVPRPMTCCAI